MRNSSNPDRQYIDALDAVIDKYSGDKHPKHPLAYAVLNAMKGISMVMEFEDQSAGIIEDAHRKALDTPVPSEDPNAELLTDLRVFLNKNSHCGVMDSSAHALLHRLHNLAVYDPWSVDLIHTVALELEEKFYELRDAEMQGMSDGVTGALIKALAEALAEAQAWQPVSELELRCGCGDCSRILYVNEDSLTIEDGDECLSSYLPDNVRLCRMVAPDGTKG